MFAAVEYQKLIDANPNKEVLNYYDKFVTLMYWAIVTISTCGYGDISPATNEGRILVIFVMFFSIGVVLLFIVNLALVLTTKKLMERRGIMNMSDLKDHFIICGWKKSMAKLINEIIYINKDISLHKIVVIANIEPDEIELFKQSNILKAKKVIILADESSGATQTEIDAKTVMAAMTVRAISKNVFVCAELLDMKFEKYLQSAHIEDIIYSNEYSILLITNSFTQVGVTKIVNELLDVHTPSFIKTFHFPTEFIGKKYSELFDYYKKTSNYYLIGLLENVGSFLERKNEAVREAQKTADIKKLIENLKEAKTMENNRPNINPDDDYIIPKNSVAIVIGKERKIENT